MAAESSARYSTRERLALVRLVQRHAHERGAVVVAPADEARRLVAAPEPLVRVDELVRDGGDLVRVPQQARDEVAADLRELVLRALLVERVDVALEQRHVRVHAAAGLAAERLRHERRVDALLDRDLFDHGAEGHDVVGRRERVGVAQVDLVLAGPALVVAELDRDAEVLEHPHRAAAEVVRRAAGHVVEVAGGVDGLGAVRAERRRLEQVELDLGVRVEREAARRRPSRASA